MVLAGWLEEYLEKRHKKRLAENRAAARAAGRAEANAAWGAWYDRMREAQAKGESFDELNPYEKALFSDLISLLNHFNRKERFFLVGQALGNREFSLGERFRQELGEVIEVEIPCDAFVAMDYHPDWISASLWAYRNPKRVGEAVCNSDGVATGTQQDVDLLIAFEQEDCYCLVLVEAKGYDSWNNKQMNEKSDRLSNYLKNLTHKCIEWFRGRFVWFLQQHREEPYDATRDVRNHLGSAGRALGTDRAYHPGGRPAQDQRPQAGLSPTDAQRHHLPAAQRMPMEPIAERAWGRQHHPSHLSEVGGTGCLAPNVGSLGGTVRRVGRRGLGMAVGGRSHGQGAFGGI